VEVAARSRNRIAGLGPVEEPADLPLRIRGRRLARSARAVTAASYHVGSGVEKQRGAISAPGWRGLCQCRAAVGHYRFSGFPCWHRRWRRLLPTSRWHATAPRLLYFSMPPGSDETGAIDGRWWLRSASILAGEVYDYRIVSGPTDATTRSQVENLLLFSRFAPARFFGQPVRGLAILSFSGVSVRG